MRRPPGRVPPSPAPSARWPAGFCAQRRAALVRASAAEQPGTRGASRRQRGLTPWSETAPSLGFRGRRPTIRLLPPRAPQAAACQGCADASPPPCSTTLRSAAALSQADCARLAALAPRSASSASTGRSSPDASSRLRIREVQQHTASPIMPARRCCIDRLVSIRSAGCLRRLGLSSHEVPVRLVAVLSLCRRSARVAVDHLGVVAAADEPRLTAQPDGLGCQIVDFH